MTSPEKCFASSTPSAVFPVAVGPTTATTGCLYDASKLLFQLLPGQFEYAGAAMRAERRHLAGKDLFGQRQQFLRRGLVPRLMAARQEIECSTHSVCSFSASWPPLSSYLRSPPAGFRHSAAPHLRAPRAAPRYCRQSPRSQRPAFSSRGMLSSRACFPPQQVDGSRLQQHLAGHIAVIRGQFFVQLALVGSVFIDQAQLVAAFCKDICSEHLAT